MSQNPDHQLAAILLVAGGVVLTLLFLGCPRDGSDTELARTAREADFLTGVRHLLAVSLKRAA